MTARNGTDTPLTADVARMCKVAEAWCSHADPGTGTHENAMALRRILDALAVASELERDNARLIEIAIEARDALAARQGAAPVSSIDYQQRRGMLADTVDWAILEYDGYMLDDDFDAQRVLDKIVGRLREVRDMLRDGAAPDAAPQVKAEGKPGNEAAADATPALAAAAPPARESFGEPENDLSPRSGVPFRPDGR